MARYYKGTGVGTHWQAPNNDARHLGFTAQSPGSPNLDSLRDHIAIGTTLSPYISLTASFAVARDYAVRGPVSPTTNQPAYVYVIDIPDTLPGDVSLVDPVQEIVHSSPPLPGPRPYHHLGPPITTIGSAPYLPLLLKALLYAERDAEVLAVHNIPATYVSGRYYVY